MADDVLVERDDDITIVTLNMPDDGNKVSDPLAVQLTELFYKANEDSRAIVLKGAGDDFCLGRSQMGRRGGDAPPEAYEARENSDVIFNAYGGFRDTKIPVIGVVQGRALGFGCALAAVCDVTIAADNARFALPEMGHNIMPTMAMSSLVDRLHRKSAVYLTYSTAEVDAHTALAYGLVSHIAPLAELDAEVDKFLAALKKAPMPAVMAVKEYARIAFSTDIRTAIDFARNLHANVNTSSRMRP